jgi:hypothetical protein
VQIVVWIHPLKTKSDVFSRLVSFYGMIYKTTVSRELILIPKVRYESLIKNEQLKETKSIQDEEVQNRNRRQKNIHTCQRENLENHFKFLFENCNGDIFT